MAARSPSLLPEMIDGNLRGLDKVFAECTWTSVRAFLAQRLCDRDGGFVAARSLLLFLQLPSKNRFDFVSFKTKTPGRAHFAFPTSNGHRGVLLARSSISIVRNEVQSRLYTL